MASTEPLERPKALILLWAALGLLLAFNVPWLAHQPLGRDVDSSWIMMLHHSFAQGMQFGSELLWHYGPLGFIYAKMYHPDTYVWMIFFHVLFSACFWVGMSALWLQSRINPAVPMIAAMLVIATDNVVFFSFSLMLVLHEMYGARGSRRPVFWMLLAALALAGWVKFSYLLLGASAVLAVEALRALRGEHVGIALAAFLLLSVLFWLLLGQSLDDLGLYLRGAWELGAGFGAMASLYRSPLYAVFYAALGAAWIYAMATTVRKSGQKKEALVLAGALLLQLLLMVKAGFIHDNDHHILQALAWFFLLALLTKDFFWKQVSRRSAAPIAVFALLGGGLFLSDYVLANRAAFAGLFSDMPAGEDISAATFAAPGERYEKTMQRLREEFPLPAGEGSADLYTIYNNVLLAQKADYRPRPVFQSYHAYTSWLARANRDFLRSDRAPGRIFFSLDTMMGRYPSLDDGLSWPDLLARYDIEAIEGGYLAMHKTATPRSFALTPLAEIDARWGAEIAVPEAHRQLVWATVEIEKNWLGKLADLLLYAPPVAMQFMLPSGYARSDRLTPATMRAGFLLSPLTDNTLHFPMLAGQGRETLIARNQVSRIAFTAQGCALFCLDYYHDTVRVRFFALELPPQNTPVAGWAEIAPYALMSAGMPQSYGSYPHGLVTGRHIAFQQQAGKNALSVYGEGRLQIPLMPLTRRLKMEMGSFVAFSSAQSTPGEIELEITRSTVLGGQPIWRATIPALKEGQVSSRPVTLDIPVRPTDDLVLSIRPRESARDNWVYVRLIN